MKNASQLLSLIGYDPSVVNEGGRTLREYLLAKLPHAPDWQAD